MKRLPPCPAPVYARPVPASTPRVPSAYDSTVTYALLVSILHLRPASVYALRTSTPSRLCLSVYTLRASTPCVRLRPASAYALSPLSVPRLRPASRGWYSRQDFLGFISGNPSDTFHQGSPEVACCFHKRGCPPPGGGGGNNEFLLCKNNCVNDLCPVTTVTRTSKIENRPLLTSK